MDFLTVVSAALAIVGLGGLVLDVTSLVKRRGARLAIAAIVLRVLGITGMFVLIYAGKGRPDFQDLVFVLYGMFWALLMWAVAAVVDVVLAVRHYLRHTPVESGPVGQSQASPTGSGSAPLNVSDE